MCGFATTFQPLQATVNGMFTTAMKPHANHDADIAESCTDEGIVCEVQEPDETVGPSPATVSASAVINYVMSLRELVCSRALGNKHVCALNKLESAMSGSALQKHACTTDFLFSWLH